MNLGHRHLPRLHPWGEGEQARHLNHVVDSGPVLTDDSLLVRHASSMLGENGAEVVLARVGRGAQR